MNKWEALFKSKISEIATADDPAHDLLHFERVTTLAKKLCAAENGKIEIVLPAAWLHDFVIIPKNDPRRKIASRLSAEKAIEFLKSIHYPEPHYEAIAHAIEAHSFSANLEAKTLEAKIVQDADRLDGLGAIGIARCFATAGLLKTQFYSSSDPLCEHREPNDQNFAVDHFYRKLFKVAETLKTPSGREEGQKRVQIMRNFLTTLNNEIKNTIL